MGLRRELFGGFDDDVQKFTEFLANFTEFLGWDDKPRIYMAVTAIWDYQGISLPSRQAEPSDCPFTVDNPESNRICNFLGY